MSTIPEVEIEGARWVSGHFHGVRVQFDGSFIVGFCIREGIAGNDLIVLHQEVQDLDNYTLDAAVDVGRRVLADNLEQLAKDIRTGNPEPIELTDKEHEAILKGIVEKDE